MQLLASTILALSLIAQGQSLPELRDSIAERTIEHIVPARQYRWNWRDAVVLKALSDIYDSEPGKADYIQDYVRSAMAASKASIHGKHPNGVASGVGLAFLMRVGCDFEQNSALARKVYEQYLLIPREKGGGVSHRSQRNVELWDDSVYMIGLFLHEMYRATGDLQYLQESARQLLAHASKLYDPRTALWFHGWAASSAITHDECCQYGWNANHLQRNTQAWGRGNGWIAMTMVDLLALLPQEAPERPQILSLYQAMMLALLPLQNPDDGHWNQLPLRTSERAEGNFSESSATAMFAYALAKGIRIGLLNAPTYRKAVDRAYEGLLTHSITSDYSLINICAGTCIGERDYYYARGKSRDESFALGALLQFLTQYNRLSNK